MAAVVTAAGFAAKIPVAPGCNPLPLNPATVAVLFGVAADTSSGFTPRVGAVDGAIVAAALGTPLLAAANNPPPPAGPKRLVLAELTATAGWVNGAAATIIYIYTVAEKKTATAGWVNGAAATNT